jgi:aromatic ring hydroxylase
MRKPDLTDVSLWATLREMIRTGAEYRESIRDGCRVWIDGERTAPAVGPLPRKYYRVGRFGADDRRRLSAFARDLLNSDYAGHRLTFQLFTQPPALAHLLHVYSSYDLSGPAELVRRYAGLSEPLEEA